MKRRIAMSTLVGLAPLMASEYCQAANEVRPFSVPEIFELDLIYTGASWKPVYLNGPKYQEFTATKGTQIVLLESSRVLLDTTGWTDIQLRQNLVNVTLKAKRSAIAAFNGDVEFGASFDAPPEHYSFLDRIEREGPWWRRVTPALMARLKQFKTPLELADHVFQLKRDDVVHQPWPRSAENMVLWLTGPQAVAAGNGNLTRYEVGGLILYATLRSTDDRTMRSGIAFNAKSGQWLGDFWISGTKEHKPIATADLEPLLCRLRAAE